MLHGIAQVLVVDDRPNMLSLMTKVLQHDAIVHAALGGHDALRLLTEIPIDLVLCDLKMPDMDGLEVLRATRRLRPDAAFILMTAYATVQNAVDAMKLGATDYLTKPFDPGVARELILETLARVCAKRPPEDSAAPQLPGIDVTSPKMRELAVLAHRVAGSEAPVLLCGEPGVGKTDVARAIHAQSGRARGPFLVLNCEAEGEASLECELFGVDGHAMGWPDASRPGLLVQAHGGTLFLREFTALTIPLQLKLARALELSCCRRVGGTMDEPFHVRIMASSSQDLEAGLKSGALRQELWYRLNVARLDVPSLRERGDESVLLSNLSTVAPSSTSLRGLEDASDDEQAPLGTWSEALERGRVDVGKKYLEAVLRRFDGQVTAAAEYAGVERESFYRLLRKYHVRLDAFRGRSGEPTS